MASVADVQIELDAALVEENNKLRRTVVELLEILRQWEPNHASAEERQAILRAMYQVGILTDPQETLRNKEVRGAEQASPAERPS